MKSRSIASLLCYALALVASSAWADPEKKAFVVGVGGYTTFSKLKNAPNDARLMAKSLGMIGFKIHGGGALIDPGAEQLQDALAGFVASLDSESEVVIYFAGHGLQSGGENLLIPADFALPKEEDAETTRRAARLQSLQLGKILTSLETAKVPVSAIFLDCCRDPGFLSETPGLTLDGGLAEPGKKNLSSGDLLIGFAAKHGQTASDGSGENSPFTEALARRLVIPGRSLREIFAEVTVDVKEATGDTQQPFSYGTLSKEIYLAGLPAGREQLAAGGGQGIGAPATVAELVAKVEPEKSHADMRTILGKPAKSMTLRKSETGLGEDIIYESYSTKHYGLQLFFARSAESGKLVLSAFTVHLHEGQSLPIYRGHPDNTLFVLGRTTAKEAWKNAGEPSNKFEAGGGRFPAEVGEFYYGRRGAYLNWLIPSPDPAFLGDPNEPAIVRSCGALSDDSWSEFLSEYVASPISWMEEGSSEPAAPETEERGEAQPGAGRQAAMNGGLAGERYPATRQRVIAPGDLTGLGFEDVRYAINEMFARRGAVFANQKVQSVYDQMPWYQPRPGLTFDQIETNHFTPLERQNLKVLGAYRDGLKK